MPSPAPLPASPAASVWVAIDRRVTDAGSAIPASIDLDQPQRGIALTHPGPSTPVNLLGLNLPSHSQLSDFWLRGDDVTAVYESADARHLRTTAMWRLSPAGNGMRAWELVASAQTSLLQSDAMLAVVSEIDAADILWGTPADGGVHWQPDHSPGATCVLLHRGGQAESHRTSVLVAAHPGEARRVSIRRNGHTTVVECWLFSTDLEKGVLLRSRVLAAIGPTADATGWAGDLAAAFAASPPFLTT
jgi:hypothetical protein